MNAPVVPVQDQWWWFGELATTRLASETSNGGVSILEILAPAGLQVPRHVHHLEDEIFVMLDGEATFGVGERTISARQGDVLFGPRGVPHDYVVGPNGCRMLFVFTPGANMEGFVRASAIRAQAPTLPPAGVTAPPADVLAPMLQAHGLAFV